MLTHSLLLPENLIQAALEEPVPTGWYGGQAWESEALRFCTHLARKGSQNIYSTAKVSFFEHRSFCKLDQRDELVRWARVRVGAHQALKDIVLPQSAMGDWVEDADFLHDVNDLDWVCLIEPSNPPRTSAWIFFESDGQRFAFSIHYEILQDHPDHHARLNTLAIPLLADKRVLVVGLGSGGGVVALDLASAGVGALDLADRDFLRQSNLIRHVAGAHDIGRTKGRTLKDVFGDHLLVPRVRVLNGDVIQKIDDIRDLVEELDLIVCCADDRRVRELLNYVCVRSGRPLILAWTLQNAALGEVIRIIPGQTGCLRCIRMVQGPAVEPPADEDRTPTPYLPESSTSTPSRATRADIFLIAELAAKVSLMTLTDDHPDVFGRPPGDYLLWCNRATPDLAPPFNFECALSLRSYTYEPQPSCPICGEPSLPEGIDVDSVYRRAVELAATPESPPFSASNFN